MFMKPKTLNYLIVMHKNKYGYCIYEKNLTIK